MILEQKERDLEAKNSQLESERSRKTSLGAMDAKGYKSVVHARMSEDRIRALEDELEKKVCDNSMDCLIVCFFYKYFQQ